MDENNNCKFNWPFFGNKHIVDFLQNSIVQGSVSHFYIFCGAKDLGKTTIAKYFAKSLFCENFLNIHIETPCGRCVSCDKIHRGAHSDIVQVHRPEGKKNISIEQVRGFVKAMSMGTFAGRYKIGIIKSAEALSAEAANALLKTLEEANNNTIIILMTEFLDALPLTIISRAQVLKFLPAASGDIYDYLVKGHKAGRDEARVLSKFCLGRPVLAVKMLEDRDFLQKKYTVMDLLIQSMTAPSYKKFALIDEILKFARDNNERAFAGEVLYLWQILMRDIILKSFNAASLAVSDDFLEKISQLNFFTDKILAINKSIERARKYLEANVSPRLVLENVSLQF